MPKDVHAKNRKWLAQKAEICDQRTGRLARHLRTAALPADFSLKERWLSGEQKRASHRCSLLRRGSIARRVRIVSAVGPTTVVIGSVSSRGSRSTVVNTSPIRAPVYPSVDARYTARRERPPYSGLRRVRRQDHPLRRSPIQRNGRSDDERSNQAGSKEAQLFHDVAPSWCANNKIGLDMTQRLSPFRAS
jgi:hypothetical protein